jgi:hypothetical protein
VSALNASPEERPREDTRQPARANAAPPVLNYSPPDRPTVSATKVFAHAVGTGFTLFFSTMIGLGAASSTGGWSISLIPVVIVALLIMAGYARRRPEGRSLAIGIWIGIGVPLLLIGLCFGIVAMQ